MRGGHNNKVRRRLIAFAVWLVVAAIVAGLIIFFTGQSAPQSDKTSKGLLRKLLEIILGEATENDLRVGNYFIRKAAHFILFAAFGFSLTAALQYQNKVPRLPVSLGAGALFAIADEVRQTFVPGRSREFGDMIIDFTGVLIGALIVTLIAFIVRRHKAKRAQTELKNGA